MVKKIIDKTKNTAIKILDVNNDGEFNKNDIIDTVAVIKNNIENTSRDLELRKLNPLFENNITSPDFALSKLIRVTDMDKKHADSELCVNSIGHIFSHNDYEIVNIYRNTLDTFGLTFYPDNGGEFYYVDPTDPTHYIDLDEYFIYLQKAREQELHRVAQDLGAKYVRVTVKEEKSSFTKKDVKASGKIKALKASSSVEHKSSESSNGKLEIKGASVYAGHDPIKPELKYLKNDTFIESLIESRMHEHGSVMKREYSIKSIDSIGIKEKDAVKIDAAFKALKISGNTTVVNEVQREALKYFEFEIEF